MKMNQFSWTILAENNTCFHCDNLYYSVYMMNVICAYYIQFIREAAQKQQQLCV